MVLSLMITLLLTYFNILFNHDDSVFDLMPIINEISPCISFGDNDTLRKPFFMSKFINALFEMNSDKSPNPDGLNLAFYRHFEMN